MLKSYEYSQKIRNGAKTRSRNDKLRTAFYLYKSSCPGFPLSFVLEIVRGRHSAQKRTCQRGPSTTVKNTYNFEVKGIEMLP